MITNESIIVYNYEKCQIIAASASSEYVFEPSIDGVPYELELPFGEIKNINSRSTVFRDGYLRFDKEQEEEIYKALLIKNYQDILTNLDIKDILLNPTKEGLTKLLNITSASYFERVRGVFSELSTGNYDVSLRIKDLIQKRYDEFKRNQTKTSLVVNAIKPTKEVEQAQEIEDLKKQLEEFKKQLAEQNKPKTVKKTTKSTETE